MRTGSGESVIADAGLSSALRVSIMRLVRRLRYERDATSNISLNQLAVMGALDRHGQLTLGELAAHEKVQPPSMTRIVSCLDELGLVRRERHPSDGRQVLVRLTDEGLRLLACDRKRGDAWLAVRLRELTPDERDGLQRAAPIIERLAES